MSWKHCHVQVSIGKYFFLINKMYTQKRMYVTCTMTGLPVMCRMKCTTTGISCAIRSTKYIFTKLLLAILTYQIQHQPIFHCKQFEVCNMAQKGTLDCNPDIQFIQKVWNRWEWQSWQIGRYIIRAFLLEVRNIPFVNVQNLRIQTHILIMPMILGALGIKYIALW